MITNTLYMARSAMITVPYLPLFVTLLFRWMPGIWKGRHRLILCWLVCVQALFPGRGTHLRRDTVIPQWFQASKAAAASDGHAVHC
jgi:hypothetical protein